MPRAIWSGAISFGLVTIPVRLYNAVSRKAVRFNQIDSATNSRVRQKLVSAADGSDVDRETLLRGYEISKDNYVTVSDDELAAIEPKAQRTIDIQEFVDLADIDPVFYDSAYHLAPDEITRKAYALLARAMAEADKVGIARFVMRGKQYVAAVRPVDGHLMLSTMVYADEVNDVDSIDELGGIDEVEVSEAELAMANQLIDSLSATFDPQKYRDTYREQVMELIERKAAGETEVVLAPAEARDQKVVDLMAALEASVAEAKSARQRHPSSGDEAAEPAAKRPAKRAAKRKSA